VFAGGGWQKLQCRWFSLVVRFFFFFFFFFFFLFLFLFFFFFGVRSGKCLANEMDRVGELLVSFVSCSLEFCHSDLSREHKNSNLTRDFHQLGLFSLLFLSSRVRVAALGSTVPPFARVSLKLHMTLRIPNPPLTLTSLSRSVRQPRHHFSLPLSLAGWLLVFFERVFLLLSLFCGGSGRSCLPWLRLSCRVVSLPPITLSTPPSSAWSPHTLLSRTAYRPPGQCSQRTRVAPMAIRSSWAHLQQ
jgi:hypothetical protein